jgi:hypothetical protein
MMKEKFEIIDPKVKWYGREFYELSGMKIPEAANDNNIDPFTEFLEHANDNNLEVRIDNRMWFEKNHS